MQAAKRARVDDSGFQEVNPPDDPGSDQEFEDADVEEVLQRVVFKVPIQIEKPHRVVKGSGKKRVEKVEYSRPPLLVLDIREDTRINQELREPIARQAGLALDQVDWNRVQWRFDSEAIGKFREIGGLVEQANAFIKELKPKGRVWGGQSRKITLRLFLTTEVPFAPGEGPPPNPIPNANDTPDLGPETVAGRLNPLRNAASNPDIILWRNKIYAAHPKGSCSDHPNDNCAKDSSNRHFILTSANVSSWATHMVRNCCIFIIAILTEPI